MIQISLHLQIYINVVQIQLYKSMGIQEKNVCGFIRFVFESFMLSPYHRLGKIHFIQLILLHHHQTNESNIQYP